MKGFDVTGALAEGYSKKDIAEHLAKENDFDIEGARKEGYSDDHIIGELTGVPYNVQATETPQKTQQEIPELFEMVGAGLGAAYGVGEAGLSGVSKNVVRRVANELKHELRHPEEMGLPKSGIGATDVTRSSGNKWLKNYAGIDRPGFTGGVPQAASVLNRAKGSPGTVKYDIAKKFGPNAKLNIIDYIEAKNAAAAAASGQPKTFGLGEYPAAIAKKGAAATHLLGRMATPAIGLSQTGLGVGHAINRLGAEDATPREKAAGATNIAGAVAGLGSMASKPLIKYPSTAASAGLNWLAEAIANEKRTQEQPVSSVMQGYAKGRAVKSGLEALKKFDLGDLEGKTIIGTMSDRTAVDLPRGLHGGPLFPTIHKNAAWAVDAPGAASRLLNSVQAAGGPEKTVIAPMLMSPTAHRSNRDVAKMALKQFQENYNAGQFSPERLAEIEMAVRKVPGLAEHPGLMDPNAINMFDKMTFGQRGAAVDWLGSKPKKAPALDLDALLRGTTEKGLEGTELGAIGPSLFRLSGERSIDPSLHGSYSHILHGELLGGMNPIPREFVFRDLEAKAMKELGRPLSDYNYRTSVGNPTQFVDEKLLRSWEELGFMKPKTGGLNNPE